MSYLGDTLKALGITLKNVLRPSTTVEFPKVIRPRAERYRASFALLHEADGDEACIGCLQCERICPSKVIAIKAGGKRESPITKKKRGYADDFTLDMSACIFCELCVQVCPTDAIVMTREPEPPAFAREDLVLTMAKLYANEKSKHRAWGDATRLNEMQKAKPSPTGEGARRADEGAPKSPAVPAPAAPTPSAAAPKPEAAPPPPDAAQPPSPALRAPSPVGEGSLPGVK